MGLGQGVSLEPRVDPLDCETRSSPTNSPPNPTTQKPAHQVSSPFPTEKQPPVGPETATHSPPSDSEPTETTVEKLVESTGWGDEESEVVEDPEEDRHQRHIVRTKIGTIFPDTTPKSPIVQPSVSEDEETKQDLNRVQRLDGASLETDPTEATFPRWVIEGPSKGSGESQQEGMLLAYPCPPHN